MKSIAWAIVLAGVLIAAAIAHQVEQSPTTSRFYVVMLLFAVLGFLISLPF